MTDNEIIKALECCLGDNPPCFACKYDGDTTTVDECMGALMKDAFDLINRQKAEIERLKSPSEMQIEVSKKLENTIKAEAVKELLDKIEKQAIPNEDDVYWVELDDIYNLVKEMVGDTE